MDKGSQTNLSLFRAPDGGFTVSRAGYAVFAATGIDAALNYMREMIEPVSPEPGPEYCEQCGLRHVTRDTCPNCNR